MTEVEKSMDSFQSGENGSIEQKSFRERLSDIPTVTMTLSQLQSLYSTVKEQNEVLKNAFNTGEQYVDRLTIAAKPVVWAATTSAFKVAQPVIGKVEDPVATIDNCASEALAKVQEKLPFVNQTPTEIVESAKTSAIDTANYYLGKAQSSSIGKQTAKQVDNALSFSELMVEICFPTDGCDLDDLKEIEKAEEDEDKGALVRAGNLKDRALRRGKRKVLSFTPVQTTVDNVHYAQTRIAEMTDKLKRGTNYATEKTFEATDLVKQVVQDTVSQGHNLVSKKWDSVYKTTLYIPQKAMEVTGEVYISAQEIVFAYTKAHSITEMPHAVAEMAESYYTTLKKETPSVETVKEKAIGFVYVPAQVVSEYLKSTRVVQWIVPKEIEMNSLQVMESEPGKTEQPETCETQCVDQAKKASVETPV